MQDEFPHLLNATDEDGRTIYADGSGGAYVLVPYSPSDLPPPPPAGWSVGNSKRVARPESMRDPFFDRHAHADIYVNADRTECRVTHSRGNPPYPPQRLPLPESLRGG